MMSLQCPECNVENTPSTLFCANCGHLFKGEPTTILGPTATAPAVASPQPAHTPDVGDAATDYPAGSGLLSAESILQDRYRITQLLGQGGMGAVYLAQDTRFASRTCVIKEMLDHFNDPEQRAQATESFHREADFLATLKHPGIPEVYDRFTEANRHYLVMEYINGVDLEQRLIDKGTPFTEKEVIAWMIQCCDVLSYLHHQNPAIIYRDMKPANVITTSWGKVSLIDFGIARFFNPVSRGTMIGTQGYAPPEQYRGQVEPRSDIYALGATMHYLLTGRDPQNEPPFSFPPVSTLNPDISPEMESLILKTLDPELENRFASADDLLGELMGLAGDETDVVRECPHCGKKSSITRQFCPHCKQYISKKAHVLKNGMGEKVTDAAGLHAVRSNGAQTARLDDINRSGATATTLAVPTTRTEFQLVSVKPLILGLTAGAVLLGATIWGLKTYLPSREDVVSAGESLIVPGTPEKRDGVSAFRSGDYQRAVVDFNKAVAEAPGDGEARIYLQNSYLHLNKVPTVKLAVAGSFTGAFKSRGAAELQGAAFAQEELNGGEQNPKLELELADDRSSTEGAVAVARRIADDSDVAGVIGHGDSNASWAAMPMYNLAGLPVISPTATSTQLTGLSPNFFRLSPDDSIQGAALAKYVTGELGAKKVAVLQPESNPHAQGFASAFASEAESGGAQVQHVAFNADTNWGQVANDLKSQGAEAIFLAGTHLDALALAKAKSAIGLNVPIIGGDSLYLPDTVKEGGASVEGLICATFYHPELDTPMAKRFESEFQGKLGMEANSRAALTYEAVELFATAAMKVGANREALAHYLKTLGHDGFDGLSGHAGLDAKGNVRRPMYLMEVQQGRFRPLTQVVL